jgi:capsular polysaccharide export protein
VSAAPALAGAVCAHGFSLRKRRLLQAFTRRTDVRFVSSGQEVPPGADLLLWGAAEAPAGTPRDARIVRVEDGFVRSVGLGADLTRPVSWVFDPVGIYFDATRPSALEQLLSHADFSADEIARAAQLAHRIVQAGLTKYNLAAPDWERPRHDRQVVLVPGQVETDASIAKGCVDVRTNMALLRAVRAARPDAWIVYKPHPDVVAGLRGRGVGEDEAAGVADEVLVHGSMHDLLAKVDEVHVMTSLAGFEGLLRGKPVVCWGQPFYAGWGLTRDMCPHQRRTRRRSRDELVAAALLRYPVYHAAGRACTAEGAVDYLVGRKASLPTKDAWWRRWVRPLLARP